MRLRQILKNRIPIMHNKKYLDFVRKTTGKVPHHFTRSFSKKIKHNDFLVYPVTVEEHREIHSTGVEDQEIAVLEIIKMLISYIKHLQEQVKELENGNN